MSSDMKVFTPRGAFRYPDVTVTCGARRFHGRGRSILTNPLLIVEVLPDRTSATDYGDKQREYQMVERLQHYLVVSQHEARVELYTRKDDGHWDYLAVEGPDGVLPLSALSITLSLADIYEGIEFDPYGDEP